MQFLVALIWLSSSVGLMLGIICFKVVVGCSYI